MLDDFDNLEATESAVLVDSLLSRAPETCHFVIAARSMPKLDSIPRLVAQREAAILTKEDFRFTAEEVRAFFSTTTGHSLSDAEAEELVREFEGWIGGIVLSLPLFWSGAPTQRLDLKKATGQVFQYLAAEVYLRQSDELRSESTRLLTMCRTGSPFFDNILRT